MCGSQADILIEIPPVKKYFSDSLNTKIGIIFKQIDDTTLSNENSMNHKDRLINIAHSIWGVQSQNFLVHENEVILANSGVVSNLKKRFSEFMISELKANGFSKDESLDE